MTKTTHSYPFFNKNDPFLSDFKDKTTHFHPFFNKNIPLPAISDGKRPTPTQFQQKQSNPTHFSINLTHPIYFSTKQTHSHHSHPFPHRSSTRATCIHQFSNYNRLSLPITINALNKPSLKNIIFENSTSEQKRIAYFSKNQIYPSMLL